MIKLDLKKISELLSKKTGKTIEFIKSEEAAAGFHSQGYKLSDTAGKEYFVKRVHTERPGFEFPERSVLSLMLNDRMARRTDAFPRPIGLIADTGYENILLPDITEETILYHVQEFATGEDYFSRLQTRLQKSDIDEQDTHEIAAVTDFLCKLHRTEYSISDSKKRRAVYNDSLLTQLTNPELTLPFLSRFHDDHQFLAPSMQNEYVLLALNSIRKWRGRSERIRAIHGDFSGLNVFFRTDETVWVIDYSRVPWGEPGIDVGWWMSQYMWFYHQSKNKYFKQLADTFLKAYIEKTGDTEIHNALVMGLIFTGVLYASPVVYPEISMAVRKRMFDHSCKIIRDNKFAWLD